MASIKPCEGLEAQDGFSHNTILVDQSNTPGAGIGGVVTVVAHNEEHTLGNGLLENKVSLFVAGKLIGIKIAVVVIIAAVEKDVWLVKKNTVNEDLACVKVDQNGLSLGCDHSLDQGHLVAVVDKVEDNHVALLWLIEKIGGEQKLLILQSVFHRAAVDLTESHTKGEEKKYFSIRSRNQSAERW